METPHGNGSVATTTEGSYRTYEEWKLALRLREPGTSFRVLTVPMRNGNILQSVTVYILDYSSYRTYEEWKPLLFQAM